VKRQYHKINGFTLIELMIVVAIVAILVALAVPAYNDFIIRSQVAECVSDSAPAKTSISEFKMTMGTWPTNMAEAGLYEGTELSTYCDYFLYNNTIRGPMGDFAIVVDIDDVTIQMVMSPVEVSSGIINWTCTRGWGPVSQLKYMPASCRGDNIYQ